MFGNERPYRHLQSLWVEGTNDEPLACARCKAGVYPIDVAIYTRTNAGDPFDPWCANCAYELVRWAGIGALHTSAFPTERARADMEALLNRGRG